MLQSGSGTPGRGAAATPERGKQIESGRMGMVCRWGMVREGGGVGGLRGGGGGRGGVLEVRRDLPELVSELLEAAVSGRACTYMSPWEGGGRREGDWGGENRKQAPRVRVSACDHAALHAVL